MELKTVIAELSEQIAEEAVASARKADDVKLMGVAKTKPISMVEEAVGAGLRLIGENYVQEIAEKYQPGKRDYSLHMIGHLQSNKAARVVPLVDSVDSVDSVKLARIIDRIGEQSSRVIPVMLEVNTSGDASKSGFASADEFLAGFEEIAGLKNVKPYGLMTLGPLGGSEKEVRAAFAMLRRLSEECGLKELSMGMSSDWRWAVQEGSTIVRIGTAIFGERDYT